MRGTTILLIFEMCIPLLFSGCYDYINGLSQTTNYDTLVLKFEADHFLVRVGEPMHIRFTIKNVGSKPWVIESEDTPIMDITVQIPGSPAFFNWASQYPDKISHRLEWKPGESKTLELTWTPSQEDFAHNDLPAFYLGGNLYVNSKIMQGASVIVCTTQTCF
jgi:hypothetical protein